MWIYIAQFLLGGGAPSSVTGCPPFWLVGLGTSGGSLDVDWFGSKQSFLIRQSTSCATRCPPVPIPTAHEPHLEEMDPASMRRTWGRRRKNREPWCRGSTSPTVSRRRATTIVFPRRRGWIKRPWCPRGGGAASMAVVAHCGSVSRHPFPELRHWLWTPRAGPTSDAAAPPLMVGGASSSPHMLWASWHASPPATVAAPGELDGFDHIVPCWPSAVLRAVDR
jgi:hypothetical protein